MGTLTYTAITSLDGFIEDASGSFAWAMPGTALHQFFNDLEASSHRILCGRRLYDVLSWWDDEENWAEEPPVVREYGRIWKAIPKVVYSRNPAVVLGPRAELRTALDLDELNRWKAETPGPTTIGGADLAGQALGAGAVDEVNLVVFPVVVGGGKPALPAGSYAALTLVETRTFPEGVVLRKYSTPEASRRTPPPGLGL